MNKILLYTNLFALQSYLFRFDLFGFPTHLQEILIGILSISYFIELIRKKKWPVIPKAPLIFLILSITASLIAPIIDIQFFIRYWRFLIFGSLLTGLFVNILDTNEKRKKGLYALSLGAIFFGILSLIVNLFGYNNTFDYRLRGLLDSAVYLGFYTAPFLIFAFSETINKFSKNKLLTTILLGLILLGTRSMGAIVASGGICTLFLFKKHKKQLLDTWIKKAIFIVLIIIMGSAVYITKIKPTLETTWSSIDERKEIYMTANYILQDKNIFLTGLGPNQFQYHYEENVKTAINNNPLDYIVLQPHNIFYFVIFNYGILGLLLLILLIFKLTKNFFKEKETSLTLQTSLMLGYFLIHGFMDTPFLKNDLLFLIVFLIELSVFTKYKKIKH